MVIYGTNANKIYGSPKVGENMKLSMDSDEKKWNGE